MALLASDGRIDFAVHNDFDPRPYSTDEMKAFRQAALRGRLNPLMVGKRSLPMNEWTIVETIPSAVAFNGEPPVFFRTRVSDSDVDDLMLLDSGIRKLTLLSHPDLPQ